MNSPSLKRVIQDKIDEICDAHVCSPQDVGDFSYEDMIRVQLLEELLESEPESTPWKCAFSIVPEPGLHLAIWYNENTNPCWGYIIADYTNGDWSNLDLKEGDKIVAFISDIELTNLDFLVSDYYTLSFEYDSLVRLPSIGSKFELAGEVQEIMNVIPSETEIKLMFYRAYKT